MPNFIKRIEKFSDNKLHSGEKVSVAVFLQRKGALANASLGAALGLIGALISYFMSRGAKKSMEMESAMAKKFPEGTILMAVTDKRILVYKHKEFGVSLESLAGEYHFGDIIKIDLKSWLLMTAVTLHFKDGGSVKLEAGMCQKLKEFVKLVCRN